MIFDNLTEEGRIVLALIDERDRLRVRVAALETALSALADHVSGSSPTGWAACSRASDLEDASRWEREAMPLLEAASAALGEPEIRPVDKEDG